MEKGMYMYEILLSVLFTRLVSQIVQATVDYQLWCDKTTVLCFKLADIPLEAWLLVSVSLLLVVVVNEVVKLHEIRYEIEEAVRNTSVVLGGGGRRDGIK